MCSSIYAAQHFNENIKKHPTPKINMRTLIFVLVQVAVAFCKHPGQQRFASASSSAQQRFASWEPFPSSWEEFPSSWETYPSSWMEEFPSSWIEYDYYGSYGSSAVAEERIVDLKKCLQKVNIPFVGCICVPSGSKCWFLVEFFDQKLK